jgi:ubiquinone biosynthesis protein COQ4
MRLDFRFDRPPLPGCTLATGPVALPPRIPRRKIQWRRAIRILRDLERDPTDTRRAFEMFEAVGGRGDDGLFRRFARTQEGAGLLARRPCLLDVLVDRAALAAMPDGSFGRAYLEFALTHGFAADGLLRERDAAFAGLDDGIGADRQWFFDRLTLSHDLWHVLTGYGTDEAGELALLGFSHAQGLNGRLVKVFALFGALIGGRPVRRFMREAYRRGRRTACLVVQPWEDLLPLPLAEVRTRLRVPPAAEAHPAGLLTRVDGGIVRIAA